MTDKEGLKKQAERLFGTKITEIRDVGARYLIFCEGSSLPISIEKIRA